MTNIKLTVSVRRTTFICALFEQVQLSQGRVFYLVIVIAIITVLQYVLLLVKYFLLADVDFKEKDYSPLLPGSSHPKDLQSDLGVSY